MQTTTQLSNLPIKSEASIKAEMDLALSRAGTTIQDIEDYFASIDFNEDNLQQIANGFALLTTLKKATEAFHEKGKKPYYEVGKIYDNLKKTTLSIHDDIHKKYNAKYLAVINEIAAKKKAAEEDAARKKQITQGIEANFISFSKKIAESATIEQLLETSKLINSERRKKTKYGDFSDDAFQKFTSLVEAIKDKKNKIKELEKLKQYEKEVEDDEELFEVRQKQSDLIEDIKLTDIDLLDGSVFGGIVESNAIQVFADIPKPKRVTWAIDMTNANINEIEKKRPEWIIKSIDKEQVNEYLKRMKEEGLGDKEEFYFAGIRFYKNITY